MQVETPIRWSRIIAGIAVILLLAVPCLIGAIVASFAGNAMLRNGAVAAGRAPGTLRFNAEDAVGTRTERPLMVHAANAPLRYATWGLFLGVFVFAGLGTLLILQGTVWRKARA